MRALSKKPYALIISGPTASGKTSLSLRLSSYLDIEVINADMGQLYKPLSVGTAKPDWKKQRVQHHLFDLIDKPKDFSFVEWRKLALKKVNEIWQRKKLPVLVGGSLFYLKSLFFPPIKTLHDKLKTQDEKIIEDVSLWDKLYKIDPKRAQEIHPHDKYRLNRALAIWEKTGKLPSRLIPKFCPSFNSRFIFIDLPKQILRNNISTRIKEMMKDDKWIEEIRQLIGTEWEKFVKRKQFIGYYEILSWIKKGQQIKTFNELICDIERKTFNYAKKQLVFWKSFKCGLTKNINSSPFFCTIMECEKVDQKTVLTIKYAIKSDIAHISFES